MKQHITYEWEASDIVPGLKVSRNDQNLFIVQSTRHDPEKTEAVFEIIQMEHGYSRRDLLSPVGVANVLNVEKCEPGWKNFGGQ